MRCIQGIALLLFAATAAYPQVTCPPLQVAKSNQEKLFFTPQQEMELGEIIRRQLEHQFLVIDDDPIIETLQKVGGRVAAQLPDTGLHYQFLLYDQPEVQAFSMPGGRIYVSRKIVAFLHNEDELAGLLGHEMGHLAARQQALDLSREFRDVLGLKAVAADEDLYERYNQYVEAIRLRKKYSRSGTNEDDNQKVADLLGVQAVARAGYNPQAFPDLLDRLMETKGKTGSWLSDLFGATQPSARRLREALKDVANLPAVCIQAKPAAATDEFRRWQAAVLHYRGIGHSEKLAGVVARKKIQDPLRGDITTFHFSSDGKYMLAQDDGGISVLTREPLQVVFRIEAEDAEPAQFSPDSRQVLFFSATLRVESWDIERQEQVSVEDVPVRRGCKQTKLSPNGKYLACFTHEMALSLYDVGSGEELYKKENFFDFEMGLGGLENVWIKIFFAFLHPVLTTLEFSPDEHYFAASSRTHEQVVFDLTTRKKINVPGSIQRAIGAAFTFVGPNKILGIDSDNQGKSPLVEFPGGKVIDHFPLGGNDLEAASNPRYILIRPVVDKPVGVLDLQERKMALSNRNSATDIWGDFMVSERLNGEIGIYKMGVSEAASNIKLPLGGLGKLQTFALSPDLHWLAISSETRGGVWDIEKNERDFLIRNFQSAYYAPNSYFYLDLPKFEKYEREMVVLSPVSKQSKERVVDEKDNAQFFGSVYLKTVKDEKKGGFELQGLDMISLKPLWTHKFVKGGPEVSGSVSTGKLVLTWIPKRAGLREELASSEKLAPYLKKENLADTDYFVEVLNVRDGSVQGGVAIRTGKDSFSLEHNEAAGDWLAIADNMNRTLVYSIATGQRKAKWFGTRPEFSRNGERLCLSNGRGKLTLYDLSSMKATGDLNFANRVSLSAFSEDAKKLFVMTSDQTVFILDAAGNQAAAAKN